MEFLKKAFNWFKLFLALDFIGVAIFLPISSYHEMQGHVDRYWAMLVIQLIFLGIGILLLFWFLRTVKKNQKRGFQVNSNEYETSFYRSYPKLVSLFEGWEFNGLGTSYFTFSNKQADGSVEAIKWLRISVLPVIPLYQEKLSSVDDIDQVYTPFISPNSNLKTYKFSQRVPLNRLLVKWTFLFYYLFFLPALVLPLGIFVFYKRQIFNTFTGSSFWIVIGSYFLWGVFLIFLSKRFSKKLFL